MISSPPACSSSNLVVIGISEKIYHLLIICFRMIPGTALWYHTTMYCPSNGYYSYVEHLVPGTRKTWYIEPGTRYQVPAGCGHFA